MNAKSSSTKGVRPFARRLQARVMRIVNVPMRVVLGLPVPTPIGNRLLLAYLTGRRSGRHYRQPLSYVRADDVLLTPGGGAWKKNLEIDRPVMLRVKGRSVTVRPEVVADLDGVGRLLGVIARENPAAMRFVGIRRDADGQFDRARLERAVHYGFSIVRWHPVSS